MSVRLENHIAAASAVAAVGTAFWHKFFPPKAHASAPAVAGLRKNSNLIDKHRDVNSVEVTEAAT